MIKIIKPGKTDFRMTCNKCGCIFEYNVEDINDGYIKCPTCHKDYYGFEPEYLEKNSFDTGLAECEPTGPLGEPGSLKTLPGEPIYQSLNECEGCPTYKQICSPTGYIGDLPCQWCNKNPWKLTCDTVTYTTSTGNATRGSRSWTTTSTTAFTEEDTKITCKAEGVEYTTTLEEYPEMSYNINLDAEQNYYTISTAAAGGTYSDSAIETYTPDSYGACCCSCSCEKASRESERSCEAEAEPTPDKCDCFSKSDKKATKKRKAAK